MKDNIKQLSRGQFLFVELAGHVHDDELAEFLRKYGLDLSEDHISLRHHHGMRTGDELTSGIVSVPKECIVTLMNWALEQAAPLNGKQVRFQMPRWDGSEHKSNFGNKRRSDQ